MTFTAEATGTSLSYRWEWKQKKKWGRSGKWQSCDAEWCNGATLTIPKVEKSHTGSYRCVVSNDVGSQTSSPTNLSVGKHCLKAECKLYPLNEFVSFLCVVDPSKATTAAKLSVGKNYFTICILSIKCSLSHILFLHLVGPPRITTHPRDLKDVIRGKPAKFTIQAAGTEPLNYRWEWKPAEDDDGSEEWQLCPAEWCDGAIILIPIQKSNEGSYCCVISNCAGSQTSNPAKLNKVS